MSEHPAFSGIQSGQRFLLDCRGRLVDCRPGRPGGAAVLGILNVTPDSFSDGGAYPNVDDALRRTEDMLEEGASIIDIGGESTRPRGSAYGEGAEAVGESEELARIMPALTAIVDRFPEAIISIDTYKPGVAREALQAGAHIINDITGLRFYPEMAAVAAEAGAPLVIMHSLGEPGNMPQAHGLTNAPEEVRATLADAATRAENMGVRHIVLDPGIGFSKTVPQNLQLLNRVGILLSLGRPVLVGISRKNTIGVVLGSRDNPAPVADRLFGTLGATAVAVLRGATLVRTHDVGPTVEMLRVLAATLAETD